jgi:uncharacterized membrane protein YhiD involved in acid resistance
MPIPVKCSQCGTGLRAPDTALGKKIKCPRCAAVVPVPAGDPEQPESEPAPVSKQAPARPRGPEPPARPERSPSPPPEEDSPRLQSSRHRRPFNEEQDDDRPRRRDRRDDDDDDRPPRRDRREAPSQGSGLPVGFGVTALVLGIIAIVFSIIPLCGSIVAWPLGGIGLLLGGVGVALAVANKRGLGLTIAGTVCNVVGIGVATAWWFWGPAILAQFVTQQQQQSLDRIQQIQREHEEKEKQRKEAEKKQKEEELEKLAKDPAFQAQRKQSQDNLRRLAQAMLEYESTTGKLPAAAWSSQPGRPQWSWRVAILPYLGAEEKELYDQLKLDEGPDSPANRKVLQDHMPDVFHSPRHPGEKNRTFYQVFAGRDGLFGSNSGQPVKTSALPRGAGNTFLIIEAAEAREWYRPGDLEYNAPFAPPPLGGIFSGHFNAAMADSTVYFVSRLAHSDDDLKQLIPARGDTIPLNWPPSRE